MKKILVAYYSFEGYTESIAHVIAETLKADIMEIKPEKELKSKGFSKYVWGGAQVVMGTSPKLDKLEFDPNQYDLIFIGTPIWAGSFAPPIKAFIEGDAMKGKDVCYFYTHEGGALNAEKKFKEIIDQNNHFISSLSVLHTKDGLELGQTQAISWALSNAEESSKIKAV